MMQSGRTVLRGGTLVATAVIMVGGVVPIAWTMSGAVYPPDCPVGKLGWLVIFAIASCFGLLGLEMHRYGKDPADSDRIVDRVANGVFISLYVGLSMGLLAATRLLGANTWGLAALLTVILVTKASDTGAYFTGRALGRHKLIPRLSPGKTWEGAIGGVLTSTIVTVVCLNWLFPLVTGGSLTHPWFAPLIIGPVLAVAGMLGDLAESLVKRDCSAKDSGDWLPGLGGVWDVTDSLIAASMPGFLCFATLA
jgi:phosphatidate cytidylyltransferase